MSQQNLPVLPNDSDHGEVRSGLALPDTWQELTQFTNARLALGRTGVSQPTVASLRFNMAHAKARDAVYAQIDGDRITDQLAKAGLKSISVQSRADSRQTYLLRPDLGRQLATTSAGLLQITPKVSGKVVVILADGLSALAANSHGPAVVCELAENYLDNLLIQPIVIATQARVALGDEIGSLLGAAISIVLIGERPGLSSPDSLGAYITWNPQVGRSDAERNCVSNIRPSGGLLIEAAAKEIAAITLYGLQLMRTGIGLKADEALLRLAAAD